MTNSMKSKSKFKFVQKKSYFRFFYFSCIFLTVFPYFLSNKKKIQNNETVGFEFLVGISNKKTRNFLSLPQPEEPFYTLFHFFKILLKLVSLIFSNSRVDKLVL